jgi:vacuolar-type H+-ATPase subunit F/Vma7
MSEAKLLVIGDKNIIFGFGLLGIEGWIAHSAEEAQEMLEQAVSEHEAEIILVSAQWAAALRAQMDKRMSASSTPIVLDLPSSTPDETGQTDRRGLLQQVLGIQLEPLRVTEEDRIGKGMSPSRPPN